MRRHRMVLVPAAVAIFAVIAILIAYAAAKRNAAMTDEQTESSATEITEIAYEQNTQEDINALFRTYYDATASGDTDTIASITENLTEEEKIRIQVIAQYIDSYTDITVYTKPGPVDGSYVAYVETKLKFKDHDWEVPGLQTMYVCTRDDGTLYINNAVEQDPEVTDYIQSVSVQDDVVDLSNQVTADYNNLVESDSELSAYLDQLSQDIDVQVGEALAGNTGSSDAAESDTEAEAQTQTTEADTSDTETTEAGASDSSESASEADAEEENSADTTSSDTSESSSDSSSESSSESTTATAKESVTIRKSASTDSERLGTAYPGEKLTVIMKQSDGWTRISYNGQTAYVKTEYLEFD